MEQDIFGCHFVCYFAPSRVKKAWAQVSYQPIRQKSPLLIQEAIFPVDTLASLQHTPLILDINVMVN